jgi:threonine dehydrogenase-like Zn-dependent dehydrogenase
VRAAVFEGPRAIAIANRPDPVIAAPNDALVRVVLDCVCGSDLWYYRGESPFEPGPIGHEFVGVVEEVGTDVRDVTRGDLVIAPFAYSDGTCPHCRAGITTSCVAGGFWASGGMDGGQAKLCAFPSPTARLSGCPARGTRTSCWPRW